MRRLVLAITLVLALAVVGCGRTNTAASANGKLHRGGVLRVVCTDTNNTMFPPEDKDLSSCDDWAFDGLYDTLLALDDHGNVHPDLATKWSVNSQGTVYTFDLRHGVTFSDGTPLNAEAVVFNLNRDRSQTTSSTASALKPITSITSNGAYTVTVALSEPDQGLLPTIAGHGCGIVSPTAVAKYGKEITLHGVGSGPFLLKSWNPGGQATFTRNPHYWKKGDDGKPLPYLSGFTLTTQGDSSVALLDLKGGTEDYDTGLAVSDFSTVQADKNLKIVNTGHIDTLQVQMYDAKPPFNNVELRRAVQAGLNRKAILNTVGFGTGYLASLPLPKSAYYYSSEPSFKYDPAAAKKDLAAAGYANGLTVTMTVIQRNPDTQVAEIVQGQLAKVGIKVKIQVVERATWINTWVAGQGQMGVNHGGGTVGAALTTNLQNFNPNSVEDWSGYTSPEMIKLFHELQTDRTDAQVKATVSRIQEIAVTQVPYVVIGSIPVPDASLSTVHGVDAGVTDLSAAWKESA